MSDWTLVDIALPAGVEEMALDILSGELYESGVAGIEIRDDPAGITAAFPAGTDVRSIVESGLEVAGIVPESVTVRSAEPIDWSTHWRRHFRPLGFGRLWVVPSWLEPPEEAEQVLRIDPGLAFGTGSHETTSLCLEGLVNGPKIRSLLDVGTGTGILAMGALLCGAERAVGTDEDPEALEVARENAAINGLAERLHLSRAEPDELGETFDTIVANILRDPLIHLAPRIVRALDPHGRVLLSGILETQADDVARAYEALGLRRDRTTVRGEWAMVELTR